MFCHRNVRNTYPHIKILYKNSIDFCDTFSLLFFSSVSKPPPSPYFSISPPLIFGPQGFLLFLREEKKSKFAFFFFAPFFPCRISRQFVTLEKNAHPSLSLSFFAGQMDGAAGKGRGEQRTKEERGYIRSFLPHSSTPPPHCRCQENGTKKEEHRIRAKRETREGGNTDKYTRSFKNQV